MKKLTAMLLALCMLLAAVPALGEETDFTGSWYCRVGEINLGFITLNADGTVNAEITGSAYEGTWSADGNTVNVTMGGNPTAFVYNGEGLVAEIMPTPFQREEGKIPYTLFSSYMNGELTEYPEGLTEADFILAQADLMTFMAANQEAITAVTHSGSAGEPEPAAELTILKENFTVMESYSGFRGTYIAKVQNNTEAPLFITGGSLTVKDADGNNAGEATYLSTSGSKYLEPGEISFVSMQADLAADGTYTFEAAVKAETKSYYGTDRMLPVSQPETETDKYDNYFIKATVTNNTEAPLAGITVLYVLEDAEGNLLDLSTESLYRHLLGAGSEITMVTSMSSKVQEYLQSKEIGVASVEVFAYADNND